MKQIPLGGKKGAGMFALVDDDMYELLNKYAWSFAPGRYAASGAKARRELGHSFMHRVVNKTPDDMFTDHIDRNPLNNQRSNLRSVTSMQNSMNSSIRKGKASKYKGVCWNAIASLWACIIHVNKQPVYLGYYRTQRDAAIAYNKAAVEHFGEYANLNDIPECDEDDQRIMKRRPKRASQSQYVGVIPRYGTFTALSKNKGGKSFIGRFPNEKFAARIYDAAAIIKFGADAVRHVNFPVLINNPLSLDSRYAFKVKPRGNAPYVCVSKHDSGKAWSSTFNIGETRSYQSFPTAEQAAEHYDKLVLIHCDNICTYLNFPEKLAQYLAEIGDQIISPKVVELPELD